MIQIRECRENEVCLLEQIEERADALFPKGLIPEDADNYSVVSLERARQSGGLLLACQDQDIVGFAVAEVIEDSYHLFLIAVLPQWGRQGIGSALLDRVAEDARRKDLVKITLTTFSHIEWNAPYYLKKGFEIILHSDASAHLIELLNCEADQGYSNRVAMQRIL